MVVIAALLALIAFPAQKPYVFKLKFPLGVTERMSLGTHMTQSFKESDSGQPMSMVIDQSGSVTSKVTKSNAKTATMRFTYNKFQTKTTVNGSPLDYPGSDVMKSVTGKQFTIDYATNGKILDIHGLDAILAIWSKSSDPTVRQMYSQMKDLFSEESIKRMWELSSRTFAPGKPVKVGDKWPVNVTFGTNDMKFAMKGSTKFSGLDSRSRAKLAIALTGSMSMKDLTPGMSLKTDSLTATGTWYFDFARGWYSAGDLTMRTKGHATVNRQGQASRFTFEQSMRMTMNWSPTR